MPYLKMFVAELLYFSTSIFIERCKFTDKILIGNIQRDI